MGRESRPWQAREEVLSYFGAREAVAKRRYRQFVFEGIGLGKRGELSTGRESREGGRRREISQARSVFCYVCLRRVGLTGRQLSEALQMSPGGIHSASVRGEAFLRENGDLEKSLTSYLNN